MTVLARGFSCARLMRISVLFCTVLFGMVSTLGRTANAGLFNLVDNNSSLDLDTNVQATGFNWIVDGVDHLTELSNWYRVGGTGPEASVDTLNILSEVLKDTNFDSVDDTLTVRYDDWQIPSRFTLTIDYAVTGGALGSGFSGLDEDIKIQNNLSTPLEFHFFEYLDLDLYSTPNDDTVMVTSPGTLSPGSLKQFDSLTDADWTFDADRIEFDNPPNTLSHLLDPFASVLNNGSPPPPLGPANVSWALQWDFDGASRPLIPAFGFATIHKEGQLQMQFVPEPSSWILVAFSALAILPRLRNGKR